MRISDWSSDVCSSDLTASASEGQICPLAPGERWAAHNAAPSPAVRAIAACLSPDRQPSSNLSLGFVNLSLDRTDDTVRDPVRHLFHTVSLWRRSEEHTSELQSLMRISYAVFCLKKKN